MFERGRERESTPYPPRCNLRPPLLVEKEGFTSLMVSVRKTLPDRKPVRLKAGREAQESVVAGI